MEKALYLGNEAVARGAWEAGVKVCSSYPGTPSTEITETVSKYPEINSEWATNEKVAMEVAYGAAVGGARAMTCMKHVGLNVAADPLFTAALVDLGFDVPESTHPIVPVMLYDAHVAREFAERMLAKGVYVVSFCYPVVPQGKARIRTQVSAAHSMDDLRFAVSKFAEVKKEMGL